MSLRSLIQLGAVAAVIGGALVVLGDLLIVLLGLSADTYTGSVPEKISSALFLAGLLLILLALPGLYLRQVEKAGTFGLVAFIVALVGTALMVGSDWSEVFIAPLLTTEAPALIDNPPALLMVGFLLNFGLHSLGWLLFGVATFRARVFPRAAAALLILGVLLPFSGLSWIYVVWNAAIVWMGLFILLERSPAPSVALAGAQ